MPFSLYPAVSSEVVISAQKEVDYQYKFNAVLDNPVLQIYFHFTRTLGDSSTGGDHLDGEFVGSGLLQYQTNSGVLLKYRCRFPYLSITASYDMVGITDYLFVPGRVTNPVLTVGAPGAMLDASLANIDTDAIPALPVSVMVVLQ